MKAMNDTQNDWQKIGIAGTQNGMLDAVKALDILCFGQGDGFDRLAQRPDDFGDIHVLQDNGRLIGYAVYGQLWLPVVPDAYISRIGVHPQHRQNGWGLKILNADPFGYSQPSATFSDLGGYTQKQYRFATALS